MPETQQQARSDNVEAFRAAAMRAIQDLRHAAAWNFSPEYSGALGEARCHSFYEAAEAVRTLPAPALAASPPPASPKPEREGEVAFMARVSANMAEVDLTPDPRTLAAARAIWMRERQSVVKLAPGLTESDAYGLAQIALEAADAVPTAPEGPLPAADRAGVADDAEWILRDAWVEMAGNHQPAEYWAAFSDAVNFTLRRLPASTTPPALAGGETEQGWAGIERDEARIAAWVTDRFGPASLNNPMERADRLLEEGIETQQAIYAEYGMALGGHTRAAGLVAHVYSKEPGDPRQEVGGVGTCVLALCHRLGVRLDTATQRELTRIEALSKAHFDKRHQAKVDAGVAAQHDHPAPPASPAEAKTGESAS